MSDRIDFLQDISLLPDQSLGIGLDPGFRVQYFKNRGRSIRNTRRVTVKRAVICISIAPPHPMSQTGRQTPYPNSGGKEASGKELRDKERHRRHSPELPEFNIQSAPFWFFIFCSEGIRRPSMHTSPVYPGW